MTIKLDQINPNDGNDRSDVVSYYTPFIPERGDPNGIVVAEPIGMIATGVGMKTLQPVTIVVDEVVMWGDHNILSVRGRVVEGSVITKATEAVSNATLMGKSRKLGYRLHERPAGLTEWTGLQDFLMGIPEGETATVNSNLFRISSLNQMAGMVGRAIGAKFEFTYTGDMVQVNRTERDAAQRKPSESRGAAHILRCLAIGETAEITEHISKVHSIRSMAPRIADEIGGKFSVTKTADGCTVTRIS